MLKGIKPRLAEAGKIKIGGLGVEKIAESGRPYRLPVKYDHFQITKIGRDEDGDLEIDEAAMAAIDPDKDGEIRAIPIILHSDEIDEVFPTAYVRYAGRRCACRGDGEKATKREIIDDKYTGREKETACTCDLLNDGTKNQCKANGKLYCSLALKSASIAGAVHIWRTTSIISIERMIGSLQQILELCGTLRGLPLMLCVSPLRVEPAGQGAITIYYCHVELRGSDLLEVQNLALESCKLRKALKGSNNYDELLLGPGVGETEEEQAEIAAEFYPPVVIDGATGEVIDEKPKAKGKQTKSDPKPEQKSKSEPKSAKPDEAKPDEKPAKSDDDTKTGKSDDQPLY